MRRHRQRQRAAELGQWSRRAPVSQWQLFYCWCCCTWRWCIWEQDIVTKDGERSGDAHGDGEGGGVLRGKPGRGSAWRSTYRCRSMQNTQEAGESIELERVKRKGEKGEKRKKKKTEKEKRPRRQRYSPPSTSTPPPELEPPKRTRHKPCRPRRRGRLCYSFYGFICSTGCSISSPESPRPCGVSTGAG